MTEKEYAIIKIPTAPDKALEILPILEALPQMVRQYAEHPDYPPGDKKILLMSNIQTFNYRIMEKTGLTKYAKKGHTKC